MPIKSGAPRRLVTLLLIAAAVIAIVASAGSGGGGATARAAANVTITARDFFWSPDTVTIQVGDTVTWTNLDSAPHTATDSGSGSLFDGVMNQGESFSYTFTQAGTFNYLCTFHPEMTGTVVVQAGSQPGASQVPDAAMPPTSTALGGSGWVASVLGGALAVLSLLAAIGGARWRRPAASP